MFRFKSPIAALFAGSMLAAALGAAPSSSEAAGPERVRVVVSYKAGSAPALRAAIAKLGGEIVVDLDEVDAMGVSVPKARLAALRALRNVESVEDDPVRTIYGRPSATHRALPASVASTQIVPYGIPLVQADQLAGATPVWTPKVCIVDSGIDATHEDLAGNMLAGKSYVPPSMGTGDWNTDQVHHGTHVAGTVAALDNGLGVVGVNGNKQVKLFIAKVFGDEGTARSTTIARAMLGCLLARANVVSMSLGGSSPSSIEQKVVTRLHDGGLLLIAAAGNAGDTSYSYPASFAEVMSVAAVDENKDWATFSQYNDEVEIAGPGVSVLSTVPMGTGREAALAVGSAAYAVNPLDGTPVASASAPLYDFGTGEVDDPAVAGKVCLIQRGNISFADKVTRCEANGGVGAVIYNNAPGNFFGTLGGAPSTIASVSASQEDGVAMKGQLGQIATIGVSATNYEYFDGTSMATPHVSGVAALVWSFHPECSAEQMRATLTKSALDIGSAGYDVKTGWGLAQAKAAFDRIATQGCGN